MEGKRPFQNRLTSVTFVSACLKASQKILEASHLLERVFLPPSEWVLALRQVTKSCFYSGACPLSHGTQWGFILGACGRHSVGYVPESLRFRGAMVRALKCLQLFSFLPVGGALSHWSCNIYISSFGVNIKILLLFIAGVTSRYFLVMMRCFVEINIYCPR